MAVSAPLLRAQFLAPEPIPEGLIHEEPYCYSGHVGVRTFIFGGNASGALIHPRVFLAAAHVLFNADALSWFEEVEFRLGQNDTRLQPNPVRAAGSFTFTSYSEAVQRSEPGEIPWQFNQDLGAAYTVSDISERYAAFDVIREGEAPLILGAQEKLVLGYPLDESAIPAEQAFLLHQLQGNLEFFHWLKSADPRYETADPDGIPHATFVAEGWRSYPGASGGPIYVKDELDGRWVQAGIVITGNESQGSAFGVIRGIDEASMDFIHQAFQASGDTRPGWVDKLSAASSEGGIWVSWEMTYLHGTWEISRRDGDGWTLVGSVDAMTPSFLDQSARPGVYSSYRIRYRDGQNVGPWSITADAKLSGNDIFSGALIGSPELSWISGGHAPFYMDEEGLRSGRIGSNEESWISSLVEGPGSFHVSWLVSCEPGEDGDIFDSFSIALDGERAALIDGEQGPIEQQLRIPAGVHEVRLIYDKDPYAQHGDDLGRVFEAQFVPDAPFSPIPGSYSLSDGWRYSNWLGTFFQSGEFWLFSPGLGWMYAMDDGGSGAYMFLSEGSLGWIWTSATTYPWVYSFDQGSWFYHQHGSSWFWSLEG